VEIFYKYPVIFPKNISDIKFSHEIIDFKKFDYDDYHNKKSWNNPILKDNSICMMLGNKGNKSILIVDENNNKDFRDDSIRLVQDYDWNKPAKLIKIKYKIFNGIEMSEDSSWTTIRTRNNNEFIFFVSHHLESNFYIDKQQYQVGIVNFHSGFCFNDPIIALTGQNRVEKDTLLEMDLLKKNEFLKLKDTYYRLDSVSNDGKFVTLVKENDFNNKIGTQVGMIAPDFNCKSIEGDSIRFKDYKGKYLLLINVSACYSKESSYTCYKDLTEAYRGKLEFLGIDKSPVFLNNSIKELKLTGNFVDANENKMIQAYRPEFCSRTCFLINPEGRIIDKFEIFDWKTNLSKFLAAKDVKSM
jgi:peroxiredoxin